MTTEAKDFINSVKKCDMFPKVPTIPLMMKTRNSVLVAFTDSFRGNDYFNVREFYLDASDVLQFGKNGISVPAAKKHELLAAFAELLNDAQNVGLKTDGTIDMTKVEAARG